MFTKNFGATYDGEWLDDMVEPRPHIIMRSFPPTAPPPAHPPKSQSHAALVETPPPHPSLFQMSGQGTMTYPNGMKYEGQWEAGQVDDTKPTRP